MGADPVNAPIPAALALLVDRVRGAVDELRAAQARVVSLKRVPAETTGDQEDAMLVRERALAAMNALEFEIAPALAELDLQATVNAIYESGRATLPDQLVIAGALAQDVHSWHGARRVIVTRHHCAFRIIEFRFANPEVWFVHEIRIGNRAQQARGPASMLHGVRLGLERLELAQDLVLDVSYVGPDTAQSIEFHALALGISSDREISEEHMQQILANLANMPTGGEPLQPYTSAPETAEEMEQVLIDVAENTRRSSELIDRDRAMLGTPLITITAVEAQALVDAIRTVIADTELKLEAESADHER